MMTHGARHRLGKLARLTQRWEEQLEARGKAWMRRRR
jgi:hypothetical protein